LFGSSLFRADRFGPLQAAACALDQERAQVHIAATTDRAEPGVEAQDTQFSVEAQDTQFSAARVGVREWVPTP